MYTSTKWKDRIVSAETGAVLQEGTDQNAANFNNMEHGIADHHVAMALTRIARSNSFVKVTNFLDGVATSNIRTETLKGKPYNATLESVDGAAIDTISVTMGGKDVTDEVFDLTDGTGSIGIISIDKVTGDIEIAAANY